MSGVTRLGGELEPLGSPGGGRAQLHTRRIAIAGIDTRMVWCEGEGPAALLLHGFCDSADTWLAVLDRMAKAGRAAVAFDLPGYGTASVHPRGHHLEHLVRFAAAAVERVAADHGGPLVVSGNSLGGWTTLRLAERDDVELAGIVPLAPAGLDMSSWFFRASRIPIAGPLITAPVPIPKAVFEDAIFRAFGQIAYGNPVGMDPSFARNFARHNNDRRLLRRRIATVRSVIPDLEAPFDPDAIKVPVHVIWGTRDLLALPSSVKRIEAMLPEAKITVLSGIGHLPQIETPEVVVAAIAEMAGRGR